MSTGRKISKCIHPDCECLDYCEGIDPYSMNPIKHSELVKRLRMNKHLPYTEEAADAIEALQQEMVELEERGDYLLKQCQIELDEKHRLNAVLARLGDEKKFIDEFIGGVRDWVDEFNARIEYARRGKE